MSTWFPFEPTGSKPPFFWIHGDSSSVFLSQHLGVDQPLYLLTHQSEDGRPARFTEVKTIAEYYLDEMCTVQKDRTILYRWVFVRGYRRAGDRTTAPSSEGGNWVIGIARSALLQPRPSFHRPLSRLSMRQHIRALSGLTRKEQVGYLLPRIENKFNSLTAPSAKSSREPYQRSVSFSVTESRWRCVAATS